MLFVGHSFGGVLSIVAARYSKPCFESQKVLTLASPLGGVEIPFVLRLLNPWSQFFKNVHSGDDFMKSVASHPLPCEVHSIVTSKGQAEWIHEPNDCVVTVESQMVFAGRSKIEMADLNHFEILLSEKPVNRICSMVVSR